ncbi:MAG: TIGR02444 family protein [Stellaceae bacterium]
MSELNLPSAAGAFWRFSRRFYDRPGVAGACLNLQDREGRDVNLLLYAAWLGLSGRGPLSAADLARAEAALAPWRQEVIEKLRAARRRVRDEPDARELYAALKSVELMAERHQQNRLEALAPAAGEIAAETRLADALANLRRYLGHDVPGAILAALTAEQGA